MYDYYRHLYLEYLCEEAPLEHNPKVVRARTRKPKVWKDFQPVLKHGTELDLDKWVDVSVNGDGPKVWVWSDQHYGHNNILGFSNRPYPNLDLMHKCMLLNHNDYVDHSDVCIWVGDVAFLNDADANELIRKHNGYKILILGNHDINKQKVKKLDFDEIHLLKHVNFKYGHSNTFDFVFTHYPCKNFDDRTINIHGHEHVAHMYTNTHQHINVNCELHGYKPVSIDALAELARKRKEFRLPK
jgi:calcineurin-like phosphoesterase family protein